MGYKEREKNRKKKIHRVLPLLAALCVCGSSAGDITIYADTASESVFEDVPESASESASDNVTESASESASDNVTENTSEKIIIEDLSSESFQSKIAKPDNVEQNGYDVIFAIDNSGSVKKKQRAARCVALKKIINRMIGSDFNVGIIYFSGEAYNYYGLTSVKEEEGMEEVLSHLSTMVDDRPDKNTNISNALEAAQSLLADSDPKRQPVIVLCSDGTNENEEHDPAYQEEADNATAEILKKLKNRGNAPAVPIYCVYLKQLYKDADKLALEEEKLRQIVNYCSEEGTEYEDYCEDRFYMVTNEDVEKLTESFENVFFKMQNNVRKRNLNFDNEWKDQLYIPSLGVSRVNIYTNKDVNWSFEYNDGIQASSVPYFWGTPEEDYCFFSMKNPDPGSWKFQMLSDDADLSNVAGQVSYIADPKVSIEMLLQEGKDSAANTRQYLLLVHVYDENGNEISVDPSATVEVIQKYVGEDQENDNFLPNMVNTDGVVSSVPLEWKGYGDYSYKVRLRYQDYIDLHYTLDTLSFVDLTSKNTGVSKRWYLILGGVILAGIFAGIFQAVKSGKKKAKRKNIEDTCEKITQTTQIARNVLSECGTLIRDLRELQKKMEYSIHELICEMCDMPFGGETKFQNIMGIDAYVDRKYLQNYFEKMGANFWEGTLENQDMNIRKAESVTANLMNNTEEEAIKGLNTQYQAICKQLESTRKFKEELEENKKNVQNTLQDIEKREKELEQMAKGEIQNSLTVKYSSCYGRTVAFKDVTDIKGRKVNGYKLGDLSIVRGRFEGLCLCHEINIPALYIYGYQGAETEYKDEGLELRGECAFYIGKITDSAGETEECVTDHAVLLAEHSYTLRINATGMGEVTMILEVGKTVKM